MVQSSYHDPYHGVLLDDTLLLDYTLVIDYTLAFTIPWLLIIP